jgi:hypothetical protein
VLRLVLAIYLTPLLAILGLVTVLVVAGTRVLAGLDLLAGHLAPGHRLLHPQPVRATGKLPFA